MSLNYLFSELYSVFEIIAKKKNIDFKVLKELSDEDAMIVTDETKIRKILGNLLENAFKYTEKGFVEFGYTIVVNEIHEFHLQTDTIHEFHLQTDTIHEFNQLQLYVKDSGIGIRPENLENIFDKFSQEEKELSQKTGGLGLGLAIVKESAELLGGKITVKSVKAKGSTFVVTIPYTPIHSQNKTQSQPVTKIKKQEKQTILIVEDEIINFTYIEILLKQILNCEILHAKNGKEAVEICKENKGVNIVLMDLKMPVMNGFDATKHIKEFRPSLFIIAQTAYTTKEEKEKAFSVGCDEFISKPLDRDILSLIFDKYLNKRNEF